MGLQFTQLYGIIIPFIKLSKDGDAGKEKPEDTDLHGGDNTVVFFKDAAKHGKRKLTGKMTAFCDGILRRLSQSKSYRQAYDAENMADNSVWTEASKLFTHPAVSQRLKALQARQDDAATESGLALRQHVERELYALSSNADSDQARLRALELLGKTERCGVFLERKTYVTDNMTEKEVQAELEQKLQAYFKESA
jgi:hypothetical protein